MREVWNDSTGRAKREIITHKYFKENRKQNPFCEISAALLSITFLLSFSGKTQIFNEVENLWTQHVTTCPDERYFTSRRREPWPN